MRSVLLVLMMTLASFSGCFGEEEIEIIPELKVDEISSAIRGQLLTIEIDSNVDWTVNRSPGFFFVDSEGVFRDAQEMIFPASQKTLELLYFF